MSTRPSQHREREKQENHIFFGAFMLRYLEHGEQHFRQVSHSQSRQKYRAQVGAQLVHARDQTPLEEGGGGRGYSMAQG